MRRIATANATRVRKSLVGTVRSPRRAGAPTGGRRRRRRSPRPVIRSIAFIGGPGRTGPASRRERERAGDRDQDDLQVGHGPRAPSIRPDRSQAFARSRRASRAGRAWAGSRRRRTRCSRRGLMVVALTTTTGGRPASASDASRRSDQPVSPGRLMSSRTRPVGGPPPSRRSASSAESTSVRRARGRGGGGPRRAQRLIVLDDQDRRLHRAASPRRRAARRPGRRHARPLWNSGRTTRPRRSARARARGSSSSPNRRPATVTLGKRPAATASIASSTSLSSCSSVELGQARVEPVCSVVVHAGRCAGVQEEIGPAGSIAPSRLPQECSAPRPGGSQLRRGRSTGPDSRRRAR